MSWMSELDDDLNITRMAIPGTHDSGAYALVNTPLTRAQDISIKEQMDIGVRALDVRCAREVLGTDYEVFHGPIPQRVRLEDVFGDIDDFLNNNPGEFIILMLKQEWFKGENLSKGINDLVNDKLGTKVWPRSNYWPSLGEVRRCVLVLSRLKTVDGRHFDTSEWQDNPKRQELTVGTSKKCRLVIQDLYQSPGAQAKYKSVTKSLNEGYYQRYNKQLFLNFTSYVSKRWVISPCLMGQKFTNPWLKTNCLYGKGVICVDGVDRAIAKHIIGMNRRNKRYRLEEVTSKNVANQECDLCKKKCTGTGYLSSWHYCKLCNALFCDSCGAGLEGMNGWTPSRTRHCSFCFAETTLV
jgi:1-phosphatidylinositol phosphodiesterase